MHHQIRDMLFFQKSKLEMILTYLKSEYTCLLDTLLLGDERRVRLFAQDIARHAEDAGESRNMLKGLLGEKTVREYATVCPMEINGQIITLADEIEELETKCFDQSQTNKKLSRAMEDVAAMRVGMIFGLHVDAGQVSMRVQ